MQNLHNRKFRKPVRKHLRNNSTSPQETFWNRLKKNQTGNFNFRRQHSIGEYVFDFYCTELKLAIELDGEDYADLIVTAYDVERDQWLKRNGIEVLRYESRWVFEYPEVIITDILEFAEKKNSTTSPGIPGTPPLKG